MTADLNRRGFLVGAASALAAVTAVQSGISLADGHSKMTRLKPQEEVSLIT